MLVAELSIKVTPSSSRNAILGWRGDELKIAVQAAPENGKANQAVLKFLKKEFGMKPELLSGEQSPQKRLGFQCSDEELQILLHKKAPLS